MVLSFIEERTNQITNQLSGCLLCLQTLLLYMRRKHTIQEILVTKRNFIDVARYRSQVNGFSYDQMRIFFSLQIFSLFR